jgi:hypothetical protein
MTLLLIDTRDPDEGGGAPELIAFPESPIERSNDIPSGTTLTTVRRVGGVGGGTFGIVTTWTAQLLPSVSTRDAVDVVSTGTVAGQTGDKAITVSYNEPGLAVPLELDLTVTLSEPGVTPTDLLFSKVSDGLLRNTIGSGVFLTNVTVSGGAGNGTWSVSGWANAVLVGTGRVVTLQTGSAPVGQLGSKVLTVTYVEGSTTLIETWTVTLVGGPTVLEQVTPDPLNLNQDDVTGTRIGQIRLDAGDGSGTWSVGGWGYVSMGDFSTDENDRPTAWIKSNKAVTGLSGERYLTVKYVGEGLPVAGLTLPVTLVLVEVTQPPVVPGTGGDFDTIPDFTQHWVPYKTTNAVITQATDGVIIQAGTSLTGGNGTDTVTWRSGFCTNNNAAPSAITSQDDVATWRGRPIKCRMVYLGWNDANASWANKKTLPGATALLQHCADNDILPLIDTATMESTCGRDFDKITNNVGGTYHANIQAFGNAIKAIFGSTKPCVIHLCRECNHTDNADYYWYAGNDPTPGVKTKFINAYKKVVDLLRGVGLNTSNYKYLLSLQKDPHGGLELANIYPGDAYVDYIGINWYDGGATSDIATETNYAAWKKKWTDRFLDFAAGRPGGPRGIVIPEWGLRHLERTGGCDNPWFSKHMKKLFVEIGSSMIAESFFRIDRYFNPANPAGTDAIHSICYRSGGSIVSGTPFKGPSPAAGGVTGGGKFVGSGGVGATSLISEQYKKDFGGAGPVVVGTSSDDSQHGQIVSKLPMDSDFEIELDVTVLDDFAGTDQQECPLFYFFMKGNGTTGHPADLNSWTAAPAGTIHRYELYGTGYRSSFGQRDPIGNNEHQFRLRRVVSGNYADQIIGTGSPNFQPGKFPFTKDHRYRCKLRKSGQTVTWSYRDQTDTAVATPAAISVTSTSLDDYTDGYFILRCMTGRKIKFNVISVTEIGAPVSPPPPPPPPPGGGDAGTGRYLPRSWNETDEAKRLTVTSQAALDTALSRTTNPVGAGWYILCDAPNGTVWGNAMTVSKAVATNAEPLIISCASPQSINLSGLLSFTAASSNVIIDGFKRAGTNAKITLNGTNNRVQRMDISGWTHANAINFDGDGCMAFWITVHDPQDWTVDEQTNWWKWINDKSLPKPGSRNRYGFTANPTARNFKMWACRAYNFPRKLDHGKGYATPFAGYSRPATGGVSYGSCQDDALQCPTDVDQMAGFTPIKQFNCMIERFLTEATHLQAFTPDHMAATWDLKGSGHHMRNCTILCSGKFDIRGGSLNVLENIWMEGHGMWVSGGDHILRNIKCVTATFNGVSSTPGIGLVAGNGKANQTTSQASAHEPFFQRAERCLLEDIRGKVTVGVDGYNNDTTDDKNPAINNILRRVSNYQLAAATFQTGTDVSQANNAITVDEPVRLTSTQAGHTAEVGTPTLFTF